MKNEDIWYETYGHGMGSDSDLPYSRQPLALDRLMYSLELEYAVRGFDRSPLHVNIRRNINNTGKWDITVRCTGINTAKMAKLRDLSMAQMDAAAYVQSLDVDVLEAAHQSLVEEGEKKRVCIQAENNAKMAADPAVTLPIAKASIKSAVDRMINSDPQIHYIVFEFGKQDGGYWNEDTKYILMDYHGHVHSKRIRFRSINPAHGKLPSQWENGSEWIESRANVECLFSEASAKNIRITDFKTGESIVKWFSKKGAQS